MKKRYVLPLLLLMMTPASCRAQALPQLFDAVGESLKEGLTQGAAMAAAQEDRELTLELSAQSGRIEEGKTLKLTITAGNPLPQEIGVCFSLKLPERLAIGQSAQWEAVLPAAKTDESTGECVPSVTEFTREIALTPGGGSETVLIETEMSMGTRFYRSVLPFELCVPDVSVSAQAVGTQGGMLFEGNVFAYEVSIANSGTAPKDVSFEMVLPGNTSLTQALPSGFTQEGGMIRGSVRAEAAAQGEGGLKPSKVVISLPLKVADDALKEDADARRLLAGALRVDGERVPLPRLQVCGAKISAKLVSESDSLQMGETAILRMMVVNTGLAPADVQMTCVLPEGLKLAKEKGKGAAEKGVATPDETAHALPPDDDSTAQAAMTIENGALAFSLQMDAAQETEEGVRPATKVIELRVMADTAQEKINEKLVGTALAWTVDGGEVQLGEAVAMRVYQKHFLGISPQDWNGIFWAGLLLLVTISLLYAAVRSDSREEDFCCE